MLNWGTDRFYLRFAALGDSATCGLGDTVNGELRGWSRILVEAMRRTHAVSFCNLAVPGARIEDVQDRQLDDAISHRADLASLIVGLNDTLRPDWDPDEAREGLLGTAWCLHESGAVLLTVTFHDHAQVLGLPGVIARRLSERIDQLNEIYEQIHHELDTLHVDLRAEPAVYRREFWAIDRLHPSELGHRLLALRFAQALEGHGIGVHHPGLGRDGDDHSRWEDLGWLVNAGLPWLGRRLQDWVPALAGKARDRAAACCRAVDTRTAAGKPLPS